MTTGDHNKKKYEARKRFVDGEMWVRCLACDKHKPADQFHRSKGRVKSECKECHSTKYAEFTERYHQKSREETRKRRIRKENELLKCKACGKELKRKDWPKQKSGRIADICCSHRTAAHVNRYLMKRGKRLCSRCENVKLIEHFPTANGKPTSPCKVCRKLAGWAVASRQRRQDRIVESDDGTLTPETMKEIFSTQTACVVCFEPMKWEEKTLDHVFPLSEGGAHSVTNAMVMCHRCNSKKRETLPKEWFSSLSDVSKESVRRYFEESKYLDVSILL